MPLKLVLTTHSVMFSFFRGEGLLEMYAGCIEDTCVDLEVEDSCLVGELFDVEPNRVRRNGGNQRCCGRL
jgi:hypothetical protein